MRERENAILHLSCAGEQGLCDRRLGRCRSGSGDGRSVHHAWGRGRRTLRHVGHTRPMGHRRWHSWSNTCTTRHHILSPVLSTCSVPVPLSNWKDASPGGMPGIIGGIPGPGGIIPPIGIILYRIESWVRPTIVFTYTAESKTKDTIKHAVLPWGHAWHDRWHSWHHRRNTRHHGGHTWT